MTAHPHDLIQQVFGVSSPNTQAAVVYPITVKGRRIMVHLNRRGKLKRARGGRPRNPNAIRDASGKSRGETVESIMAVALAQPHRASLPEKDRHDAMAGEPLGWLRLNGKISPVEYDAGERYAKLFGNYLAALNASNPDTRPRPGSVREISREEYLRSLAVYDAAFASMGTREAREVARVAIHYRPWESIELLSRGLKALALHFGLTKPLERVMAK